MSDLRSTGDRNYSPREIAQAAGVHESQVLTILGGSDRYVPHPEAVHIGRFLRRAPRSPFALLAGRADQSRPTGLPFAISSTAHVAIFAATVFLTSFGMSSAGATVASAPAENMPLIFVALPGPGGGGGGGGLREKPPPPRAKREGLHALSSPIPLRKPPKPIEAVPDPPAPEPEPIKAEPLPVVVAPVVAAPADETTRPGVLEKTPVENTSHGPGSDGGAGKGAGAGLGEGNGDGIGPGSGGGTGGGPYRPGSGIEPPSVLHEVKPDYTEDARIRQLEGEVVLEVVVRRDGSVGDLKVLRGLGGGLNDRAIQAVRQWRFSPARRKGTPVDVIVQVAVEFKLR
jgi:periplasmic protein TonB